MKSNFRNGDATTEDVAEYVSDTAPSVLLLNPPYETKNGCVKIVKSALDNAPKGARVAIILPVWFVCVNAIKCCL